MKKFLAACAAVVVASVGIVMAAEIQSGLEKGDSVPPFNVKDVTGPAKSGNELCYRCRYGDQPVISIFAKEMTDEVAQLSKELDNVIATPHTAGSSVESTRESKVRGARHAVAVLKGFWPAHVVNPEVAPRVPLKTER